jgi:predicted Co/Zn/Cd cation transporter (cation efflux family)
MVQELSNNDTGLDNMTESVDELREKLANMKRLMEERKGTTLGDISARKYRTQPSNIIDGNFLSWIFGTALAVILSVTFYAFYNLYNAVLKKFPSKHSEL